MRNCGGEARLHYKAQGTRHKAQVARVARREERKEKREEWRAGHPHPILRHKAISRGGYYPPERG